MLVRNEQANLQPTLNKGAGGASLTIFVRVKGATKLHFTHYSCEVILLFNTGLFWSAFSTYFFGKLVFRLPMFDVFSVCSEVWIRRHILELWDLEHLDYSIYRIIVFILAMWSSVILFSLYKHIKSIVLKNSLLAHISKRKHVFRQYLSFIWKTYFIKKFAKVTKHNQKRINKEI